MSPAEKASKIMSLHEFNDASEHAYGAVVYQKSEYQDGSSSVCLVVSKSKVAPLQSISIRLELMLLKIRCLINTPLGCYM